MKTSLDTPDLKKEKKKGREISEKSRTDRQRTVAIDPKHIEGFNESKTETFANEAVNKDMAVKWQIY